MHPLAQRFAIINVAANPPVYLDTNNKFTEKLDEARLFDSLKDGRAALPVMHEALQIWGDEQKNFAVVPTVRHDVQPIQLKALPPPDFYEVGDATLASTIIDLLSRETVACSFLPVDNITGAGQMMSGLGTDMHDDRAVGRVAKFSFPGWMEVSEIELLRESATRFKQWKNCRVVNRGNGFAKWFIVILSAELK